MLADGITGMIRDGLCSIGIESYMVLNHIADTKVKSKGHTSRDTITGAPIMRSGETCVRYNWQEMQALFHSNSEVLLSALYADSGVVGIYPYCLTCNRLVDCNKLNRCIYCDAIIEASISASRPMNAVNSISNILGIDIKMTADSDI
jgi:hypothetical protein